jgi:hypothetical protein
MTRPALKHPENVLENLFTNLGEYDMPTFDEWIAYTKRTYGCCFHWSET